MKPTEPADIGTRVRVVFVDGSSEMFEAVPSSDGTVLWGSSSRANFTWSEVLAIPGQFRIDVTYSPITATATAKETPNEHRQI